MSVQNICRNREPLVPGHNKLNFNIRQTNEFLAHNNVISLTMYALDVNIREETEYLHVLLEAL